MKNLLSTPPSRASYRTPSVSALFLKPRVFMSSVTMSDFSEDTTDSSNAWVID